MLLKSGEKIIRQEDGVSINIKHAEQGDLGSMKGALFLTNQRLLMEQKSGMFSKTSNLVLDLPISRISNVGIEGMFGKKLVLQIPWKLSDKSRLSNIAAASVGEVEVKAACGVKEPEAWVSSIRDAISQ